MPAPASASPRTATAGCAGIRSASGPDSPALEAEVQENRRLNRRIAELTDVVAELLVPLADRDEERVQEVLAAYRAGL